MKSRKVVCVLGMVIVLLAGMATALVAQEEAPSGKQLLEEAKRLFAVHKYEAALRRLNQIDRAGLTGFDKPAYDSLLEKTQKAVNAKVADERAFEQGKEALISNRYATAVDRLSQAAKSAYLGSEMRDTARGLLEVARERHRSAQAQAKSLLDRAKRALSNGRLDDARKMVDQIKSLDVKLGIWERGSLSDLEKRIPVAMAAEGIRPAPPVVTAPPGPAPPKKVPVEMEPLVVAPEEVDEGPPPIVVAPRPVAEPPTLAEQARRAEAEDQVKLGETALADHEYEKAKIHFSRALAQWPDYERAKKGRDEAMRLLAEKEEPILKYVQTAQDIERQRIMAEIQELLAQAERTAARAQRVEGFADALRPLSQADRVIDVARVLTLEEAERLRERVLVLRNDIVSRKDAAEAARRGKALEEARIAEEKRRDRDQRDRERKVEQLWDRAKELRRSMRFAEAVQVLDRLVLIDPDNERARLWRDDLLYLESQERQVSIRQKRKTGLVEALIDAEEASAHPGEQIHGVTTFLRYPDARTWKQLTEFRREFTQAVTREPEAVAQTRRRLKEKIDLDFDHTSLDNVLTYLGEVQRELNIVVDPDVAAAGIDLSSRVVDLQVTGVSIEAVLALILGADLGYKVDAGYILVTTREKLQQNLPVVTYPVQDLVASIPDFGGQAPRFEVGDVIEGGAAAAGGGGGLFGAEGAGEEGEEGWQELVDIIQNMVSNLSDPDVAAWADEGGPAAVEYMNGLLIVTQTPRGHEKVADLLEQLRRERAIMISVESRFIQVTDDFLQDITLDVDVAFIDSQRFQPGVGIDAGGFWVANPVTDPGAVAAGAGFPTLPGVPGPISWFPGGQPGPVTGMMGQPIMISGTGSNGLGTATLLPLAGTAFANFAANEGGLAVSGVFLDDIQVGFLLRAIQADSRNTTLFAPRITLYNGQRAYISVATVVTYVADAEPVVAEAAVGWDPTIGSIPVGATLDVKATVSADRRYVQMDLRPQVASVTVPMPTRVITAAVPALGIATITIDLPAVAVEDLKTTASVPDGGTLLLGGNKRFIESEVETGVPVLSKIPIIRRLFHDRASVRRSSNLLILIRPKIIIQAEEENRLGYDDM